MKTILLASALAVSFAGAAAAQGMAPAPAPEDEMLFDGSPPTEGADRISAPNLQDTTASGVTVPLNEAVAPDRPDEPAAASWIGMKVVDHDGQPLGEIDDVVASGSGTPDTVILRRPDGGVQTVPAEAFTNAGGEIVADRSDDEIAPAPPAPRSEQGPPQGGLFHAWASGGGVQDAPRSQRHAGKRKGRPAGDGLSEKRSVSQGKLVEPGGVEPPTS